MTVWSPLENPPPRRAPALSAGADDIDVDVIDEQLFSQGYPALHAVEALPGPADPNRRALLEVERRRDALERQAELHHRERDLGLDADDHCFGPAQPRHVRDVAQRADGEGIHDVERRHVDDHTAGAILSDALDQGLA